MLQFFSQPLQTFAAGCVEHKFLGLDPWYHYLNLAGKVQFNASTQHCEVVTFSNGFRVTDLALIGLSIVDILLRLAALLAIGYIMYGGFRLITAQGEPEGIKHGQQTMWNALIGLGIALASIGAVSFAGRIIH